MSKKIEFKIPQPCHVNWQQMEPVEQGRFCNACTKTVIDFSMMTDAEIVQHFSATSGNICGRFYTGQLNRSVTVPDNASKQSLWQYVWKMVLAISLNVSAANAQEKPVQKKGAVSGQRAGGIQPRFEVDVEQGLMHREIRMKILDAEDNLPIPFASINIPQLNLMMAADSLGCFEVPAPSNTDDFTIDISSVGYEAKLVSSKLVFNKESLDNTILLQRSSAQCSPVVIYGSGSLERLVGIAGGAFSVQRVTPFEFIKDTITGFFVDRTLNIFPNPVAAGSIMQIRLNLKRPGRYEMIIANSAGQVVSTEAFDFMVKNQVRPYLVPSKYPRGFYFLRIQGLDKQEYYTRKFLIK